MPSNLVERVNAQIDDPLLERLSDALGIEGSRTPIVMSAAVPGLLSALSLAAHRPEGAQALLALDTRSADKGHAEELARSLAAGSGTALADRGGEWLDELIGDRRMQGLAEAFAKFCDVERGRARSALGLLAPLVIATLKRAAVPANGATDTVALQSMLLDQRNAVDAAMPAAFADELEACGVFASADTDAEPMTAVGTRAPVPSVLRQTLGWLLPLLFLLALAFAGMRLVSARVEAELDEQDRSGRAVPTTSIELGQRIA